MPGTDEELIALVNGLVSCRIGCGEIEDIRWADGTPISRAEWRSAMLMVEYIGRCQRKPPGQRAAMRLLRSLLSPEQRRTLRVSKCFYATSPGGATFRFIPRVGQTARVERHGSRYFRVSTFCLHDEEGTDKMPPADIALAHMLLIKADEERFFAMANEHKDSPQMWNGEYLRGLRRAREEREAG
ncbi:MAG TPA: hypothetical protein VNU68_07180 [Verrucomicrobiae bacterium]|nr:hypothetical protein [Verrucomicrobiae bacterium]